MLANAYAESTLILAVLAKSNEACARTLAELALAKAASAVVLAVLAKV